MKITFLNLREYIQQNYILKLYFLKCKIILFNENNVFKWGIFLILVCLLCAFE